MKRSLFASAALLSVIAWTPVLANDPPSVEHQPALCTVAAKAIELCASVLDDGDIAKVRTYFRKPGEKEYFVTEMKFEGARFCATLPGVKEGKLKTLEYYIQATDTEYETKRTSTYQLQIQSDTECGFPAVQKDAKKAAAINVQATSAKQGSKLPDYFDPVGVSLAPAAGVKK